MNARKATVPLLMAAILGTALAFSILEVQRVSAASNDNDTATKSGQALKGQISSVQIGSTGQPEWIQSGIWVIRIFSSDPQHPSAQLVARFEMVKPDGTAAHQHSISDFKVTQMTQEASSTNVLKGTATVTMKNGPVADVPVTVKVFNNAVIGIWIGPDKVDSHFGTGPIYGTLSILNSKPAAASPTTTNGTTTTPTNSTGSSSVTSGQNNNNSTNTATSAIKMNAQEVNGTYRWSTSDGINPTLKMTANADNAVQIANPTDTKHELVIESSGKELATSGDIAPDSSGHLSFKPTAAGTYAYHCEYHPDTMKGTIEVTNPS